MVVRSFPAGNGVEGNEDEAGAMVSEDENKVGAPSGCAGNLGGGDKFRGGRVGVIADFRRAVGIKSDRLGECGLTCGRCKKIIDEDESHDHWSEQKNYHGCDNEEADVASHDAGNRRDSGGEDEPQAIAFKPHPQEAP